MKYLLLFILLGACYKKQDFENDLAVPPVLKEYHKQKKEGLKE
jgi:hypothetical protein